MVHSSETEPTPPRSRKKIIQGAGAVIAGATAAVITIVGVTHKGEKHDATRLRTGPVPTLEKPGPTSTTLASTTTTVERAKADEIDNWPVEGSPEAQKKIRASLRLIQSLEDQKFWKIVDRFHATLIADAEVTSVKPGLREININNQERNYLPTNTGNAEQDKINEENNEKWLASSIVHDSVQGDEWLNGDVYYGATAEDLALHEQAKVLTAMHGDSNQINWVNNEVDPTNSPASYWNRYENGLIIPLPQTATLPDKTTITLSTPPTSSKGS